MIFYNIGDFLKNQLDNEKHMNKKYRIVRKSRYRDGDLVNTEYAVEVCIVFLFIFRIWFEKAVFVRKENAEKRIRDLTANSPINGLIREVISDDPNFKKI